MGGSSYSDDHYKSRVADRAKRGAPTFAHTDDVKTGKAGALHKDLDPKGVTREARDSADHPASVPIGVIFDVTGSMSGVPVTLQKKIPELMSLLLRKGYIQDPQILFGAVGDVFSDQAPLQVGQFESGIEMDDDITKIYLEGNGGGGIPQESYQNVFYFFARHTLSDAWEKRAKKGYVFVIGDEMPYPTSTKAEIKKVFGDAVQADLSVQELIAECSKRYHIFFVTPGHTSHGHAFKDHWGELVGPQNVISLDDPEAVCETIGVAIGLVEGTTDLHTMAADLASVGVSPSVASAVATGLDPLAKSTALTVAGTGSLPESAAPSAAITRL